MGELYQAFPEMPKNIRQIGEPDPVLRLYMEDYVNTYLKRLESAGKGLRAGLLMGTKETRDERTCIFIDGALEMEIQSPDGEQVEFSKEAWKKAYEEAETCFPGRKVQGWFICGDPECGLDPLHYWRQHNTYFSGSSQLMYLNSGPEGEEAIYTASSDGFYRLKGYSVYYERNQRMQDYMIRRKDFMRTEEGVNDQAIRNFRKKLEERQETVDRHKNAAGFLTGVCGVLAVAFLAGTVATYGNYRKLHQMEDVIVSALPRELRGEPAIQEARGQVYPTVGEESTSKEDSARSESKMTAAENSQTSIEAGTQAQRSEKTDEPETASFESTENPTETEQSSEAGDTKPAKEAVIPNAVSLTGYKTYLVEPGETLYGICAKLYRGSRYLEEICRVNGLKNPDSIYAGQVLLVP